MRFSLTASFSTGWNSHSFDELPEGAHNNLSRDGVSEGQFEAVGEHEVQQIKCEPSRSIIR